MTYICAKVLLLLLTTLDQGNVSILVYVDLFICSVCTCYVLGALLETRNTVVSKRDKVLDLMFKL